MVAVNAAEPNAWAVEDASIRFVVALTQMPSHPSAGYFINLDDGGLLPGPFPEPVVFDASGKLLESAVLWHARENSCGVVFQAPAGGETVVIYVRGSKKLKTWRPESGITPSAILCEVNGTSTKAAAIRLGSLGTVDAKTHFINQAWADASWQGVALPLAMREWKIGGNAMYLFGYIDVDAPGPTWVAPQIRSGQMDIVIDGKTVSLSKKNEKLGGIGGEVNLTAGLHKVELYGYSDSGKPIGPMMFTWRTPKTTVAELGGPRPKDLRYAGTPMCESCIIDPSRVVNSGACKIRDIESRAGLVAAFDLEAASLFAFPEEEPLIAYTLKAWSNNNPKETRYTWTFEQAPEASAEGAETYWLFKGERHGRITLTAEVAGKRVSMTRLVYFYTTLSSSIDDPETRYDFKRACFAMLKAYPDKVDPTATWDDAMWNNFFRVFEITQGNALLEYIVTQRWDFFKKKLTAEKKALLEDVFLLSMGPRQPQEAVKWALKMSADEFIGGRAAVLRLKAAEILMYYLNDLEGARRIITPLLSKSDEGGEWAKIRMGDLEFLSRNINAATLRYGDVQNRAKAAQPDIAPTRLSSLSASTARGHKRKEKPTAEKSIAGNSKETPAAAEEPIFKPMTQPSLLPSWKLSAIRDVAASENVNILIEQEFYLKAFFELQKWERVFPMAKINGDYILCEAKLYRALKDYKRAREILSAYCEQVDISNFLGEAMSLNRQCMVDMKEPAEVIEKYEAEIRKRNFFGTQE